MNFDEVVQNRLQQMKKSSAPNYDLWPEKCGGSRNALVIFIGPSPGGKKEINRRQRKLNHVEPLWDIPYVEPIEWSRGFKLSFKTIVETIIGKDYETSAKLISLLNMDWMQNPESSDVSYRYMWEGCNHIIPIINQCVPSLLIPMDTKTFGVLQIALYNNEYDICPVASGKIKIRISDQGKKPR